VAGPRLRPKVVEACLRLIGDRPGSLQLRQEISALRDQHPQDLETFGPVLRVDLVGPW
jgi:hypothetical protein